MKDCLLILIFCVGVFASWDNAYSGNGDIVMPNNKIDYDRKFKKDAEDKAIYDESMRNCIVPKVEVEDNMAKTKKVDTNKIFYSTSKRLYYQKAIKDHKKFPTIE